MPDSTIPPTSLHPHDVPDDMATHDHREPDRDERHPEGPALDRASRRDDDLVPPPHEPPSEPRSC